MGISKEAEKHRPKKPSTGFFTFCAEQREEAKKKDPEAKLTAGELGDMWKDLKEDEREEYNNEYKDKKAEWDKEIEEWMDKYDITDSDMKADRKSRRKDSPGKGSRTRAGKTKKNRTPSPSPRKSPRRDKSKKEKSPSPAKNRGRPKSKK